ncbi:hypothetical protein V6U81_09060 [Micromonospora sp. CPCC 205711]|uniref:hypothetical protein n=1 Tax=Micromonospora sp. CPCC 205547 TaxID=3122400 RepID=UPI002FEF55C9
MLELHNAVDAAPSTMDSDGTSDLADGVPAAPDGAAAPEPTTPPRRRRFPRIGGWLPTALVLAATAVVLNWYGVSGKDIALFAGYTVGCVALPGTLLWRALHGRSGTLAVDVAAGFALGLAVELAVYIPARAVDVPLAVLGWPALTVVAFLAVPRLRRHWRGGPERLPLGVSWALAGFALFMLARSALFFRTEALTGPASLTPNVDLPFQIALVGEFRHHMRPTAPYVATEALQYHWYAHAHAAASSWITGIEPQVLILRLLVLPIVAAFLVLVVGVLRAISGRWWPGPVALLLLYLGTATVPYAWTSAPVFDATLLDTFWLSPTQTMAATLALAVLLVLARLLREAAAPVGGWAALVLLVGAVAGAKATFVPALACGLLLALVGQLVTRRRRLRTLSALAIVLAWFAFAQYVLFNGGSYGTEVAPLSVVRWSMVGGLVLGAPMPTEPWSALGTLALISLLACAFGLVGIVGVLRRRWLSDPAVLFMAGFAAAGIGAMYTFGHPGLSEIYFGRTARPYLAMLAALGLASLLPRAAELRRGARVALVGLLALAAALGVSAVFVVRNGAGRYRPAGLHLLEGVVEPYLALVAVLVALGVVLLVLARLVRLAPSAGVAAVVVLFAATSAVSDSGQLRYMTELVSSGAPLRDLTVSEPSIPVGGIEAARWLREHSDPGDLVATNRHCRFPARPLCDNRDFWLAAYSERRVLVEGWAYVEQALTDRTIYDHLGGSPYWDPQRLSHNDAVFTAPTEVNVAALAENHGIRWLVAVEPGVNPDLARYATPRFVSYDVTVFEIRR